MSRSSATLSEAAHSVADTTAQVLLLVAVKSGAKPADQRYPLGHGRAAILWQSSRPGSFVAGSGFAITQVIHTISHGEDADNIWLIVKPLISRYMSHHRALSAWVAIEFRHARHQTVPG